MTLIVYHSLCTGNTAAHSFNMSNHAKQKNTSYVESSCERECAPYIDGEVTKEAFVRSYITNLSFHDIHSDIIIFGEFKYPLAPFGQTILEIGLTKYLIKTISTNNDGEDSEQRYFSFFFRQSFPTHFTITNLKKTALAGSCIFQLTTHSNIDKTSNLICVHIPNAIAKKTKNLIPYLKKIIPAGRYVLFGDTNEGRPGRMDLIIPDGRTQTQDYFDGDEYKEVSDDDDWSDSSAGPTIDTRGRKRKATGGGDRSYHDTVITNQNLENSPRDMQIKNNKQERLNIVRYKTIAPLLNINGQQYTISDHSGIMFAVYPPTYNAEIEQGNISGDSKKREKVYKKRKKGI